MNEPLSRPHRLERRHFREDFESGAAELDDWLHRYALQNQRANSAVTYVTCAENIVVGYYALAVGAVSRDSVPSSIQKSAPQQVPCILLARLAVDSHFSGRGVGAALLNDALRRSLAVSSSVGAMAVLIQARNDAAREFYEHHVECFRSPVDELQLMIPMKHLAQVYGVA